MSQNPSDQTKQETTTIPDPSLNDRSSASLSISHVTSICASGLLLCFFLPWINLLLVKPSGVDFAKEGGMYLSLWIMPALAGLTILAGMVKQGQKTLAQFTGVVPFFFFGYALFSEGRDLISILEPAVYAGLFLSLMLVIFSQRLK